MPTASMSFASCGGYLIAHAGNVFMAKVGREGLLRPVSVARDVVGSDIGVEAGGKHVILIDGHEIIDLQCH